MEDNFGTPGVPPVACSRRYLLGKTSKLNENDIYGNIMQQVQIVNVYGDILQERENLKNQGFPQLEGPVHPLNSMEVLQHASYDYY